MKLFRLVSFTVVGFLFMQGAQQAWAQNPFARPGMSPYTRPAYSPYLNLNRFGSSAAQNYYGIVRPELQANAELLQLQQRLGAQQQAITSLQYSEFQTGHGAGFMTHHRFFMTGFGQAGGSRPTGGSFTGGTGLGQAGIGGIGQTQRPPVSSVGAGRY